MAILVFHHFYTPNTTTEAIKAEAEEFVITSEG